MILCTAAVTSLAVIWTLLEYYIFRSNPSISDDESRVGNNVDMMMMMRREPPTRRITPTPSQPATPHHPPVLLELQVEKIVRFNHPQRPAGDAAVNIVECAICLEEFIAGELCRVLEPCNHMFHPECINSWLVDEKTPSAVAAATQSSGNAERRVGGSSMIRMAASAPRTPPNAPTHPSNSTAVLVLELQVRKTVKFDPQHPVAVNVECAICLEEFIAGNSCMVLEPCNHMFHEDCISSWLVAEPTCPVCRGSAVIYVQ
ncbi:hypothetical protein Syun_005020 [Stephania yunnanensis]|uniref:RING-type E3 ubiquitin transferase n=1 Tax=Stephania yunnanensis TaxID=152371 RepID=A0AAP0L5I0_9MAGN